MHLQALRFFVRHPISDGYRGQTLSFLPWGVSACRGRPDRFEDVFLQLPILDKGLDLTFELVALGRQVPVVLMVLVELASIPLCGILRERSGAS